ncbi:MAG: hypothetical protein JJ964_16015 [Rhizobiales bacterium]|nr:hypothetical protein [Hyphomicrobiales bacterium]
MTKKYSDNDNPRLEPNNMQRKDLAPRGMVGTTNSTPIASTPEQDEKAKAYLEKLKKDRERSIENKQGMYGEQEGPFVAKRHFDRSR